MRMTELNKSNLEQLWKLAGEASDGLKEGTNYFLSKVDNAEWPNRIWTKHECTETTLMEIKSEMMKMPQITFSHFNEVESEIYVFSEKGFELKSLQYGMSLPLKNKFKLQQDIRLERVNNKTQANLWSKAFHDSFQYHISTETILKTSDSFEYYLLKHNETWLGTLLLLPSGSTMGIHSLGITPSQRRKGYAREVMNSVINRLIDQNFSLATLQASEMAKNMYSTMGFSIDFIMENYRLKH